MVLVGGLDSGIATFEMNVARLINNNINNRGKQVCGVR